MTLESLHAELPFSTIEKQRALERFFQETGPTVVAFSGGTDSAYVAWVAHAVLGERMMAVTADSPSLSRYQLKGAIEFAASLGIPHRVIKTEEIRREEYASNPPGRCYFCKLELHTRLSELRAHLGFATICDGTNLDDANDYRPGRQAARELGVLSPLLDCEITKPEVRALSRAAGLVTWDLPASACLSSRVPYGQRVTAGKLWMIERGEEILRELGFRVCRVRHYGDAAGIEVSADELPRALTPVMEAELKRLFIPVGFKTVVVDPKGYRHGSLNGSLAPVTLRRGASA